MSTALSAPVLPTYARQDVSFVSGEGSWLVADSGERYLDLVAGVAVVSLGHCHPAPLAAAHEQLDLLWHTSNLYWTEPMAELAERLSARFGGAQAFFCNSGAEAVELLVRGGERGGVAMAEPDDGDPTHEIEVALARVGDEPRARARDEGDVLSCVGREHAGGERGVHASTAVSPISALTPSLAAVTAARSLGTIPPSRSPAASRSSA